jgi:uroporphyrin-III C-methyltransferase / precorrin-2 dehydrogenase / sirohydrochlorin ferrochelatase
MNLQPIFLKLEGRRGLLVGAGNVALEKISTLLKTGVRLRVIAPEARDEVKELAREGKLEWVARAFEPADLDGNFIVIAATDVSEVNAAVYRGAVERNILCNSVDDIPNCDFFFGSVVNRGDLQVAISTAGESPSLAQRLRREIDEQLPQDLGPWLKTIGELRREILATYPRGEERRLILHELAERKVCDSPTCSTRQLAGKNRAQRGSIYLVGAGPGDPDLLTVKALRLIGSADVVLHDDLVTPAILELARPDAAIVNVGKRCGVKNITQDEINALMIENARAGRSVVRLKSGDPMLFGRAAEEMTALKNAGVAHEVVPGVSAAFAAASSLGCSLTDRNWASNVIFSTGHHAQSHNRAPLPALEDATRVVYMPGRDLALLAEEWMAEGLPADLPCALVSHAAQPDEQVLATTLGKLHEAPVAAAPSLLLAGWAVREIGAPVALSDTASVSG